MTKAEATAVAQRTGKALDLLGDYVRVDLSTRENQIAIQEAIKQARHEIHSVKIMADAELGGK